ncbi:hypothetical protein FD754_012283 [Muntiacus muntjak]|uniref:Uncharacterized protein n=1 Tax=Muntiacus muntjak TaxID=9888 RepID=A0A5N3VGY1_MUNMU|nr:hypothetical protein FD754_012283 [Muntiacus muntjak]
MLRTPSRVPRVAAPRNKCRVPWQRREFPGPGGRKRPPPSSRLGEQNPAKRPEIGPALPTGGPRRRAQPASAAQRSGLHSRPPPLSPLRKPGGSYQPPGKLGKGVTGGQRKLVLGPRLWKGENSPANRQSFSALDFWITTSISF